MLGDADLAFLIDPIDGTRNVVAGLPLFGMMVAVCHRGDVLAGVIYDPVAHDWSRAVRGAGAWSEAGDGTQAPRKVAQPVLQPEVDGFIDTGFLPAQIRSTTWKKRGRQSGEQSSGAGLIN